MTDSERLDWLERTLFAGHWDGTPGRKPTWRLAGPYRHTLALMRGETLRNAIDIAATTTVCYCGVCPLCAPR